MQNNIQFERANPLQQLVGLSRQMALPHEFAPARFPSFPALERTAVMGFNVPATYSLKTHPLNGNVHRGMLTRQASYPLWLDEDNTAPWAFTLIFADDIARIVGGAGAPMDTPLSSWYVGAVARSLTVPGTSLAVAPQCGTPVVGLDNATGPAIWFYAPKDGTICITTTIVLGGAYTTDPQLVVTLEKWEAPGQVTESNQVYLTWVSTATSMYAKIIPTASGWYRFSRLQATASTATSATATFMNYSVVVTNSPMVAVVAPTATLSPDFNVGADLGVRSLMPFTKPPEFANSRLPYSSTRTTAASVLFTNVTKVLNKEGTVLGGRLNPATSNVFNFEATDLATLHPAEKQLLGLETGFYTFCPPSTDLAHFWDYTLTVANDFRPTIPLYRLDNDSLVNCFVFDDPDGSTNLAVNLDWHLEFRTTSALWQIALSTVPLEVLHQAQLALVSAGFFFQNETHEAVLKKVLPVLKSAASSLMPALASMNPLTKVAYKATKQIMSSRPKKGPAPTSLKQSSRSDAKQPPQPKKNGKGGKGKGNGKGKGKKW